jgi:ligand-binding sensor domain-containing protein/serine phosphatase RsbU (regulator of sigma subunit)
MLVGTTFGIDRIYNGKIEPYYCHDTVQSVNTVARYMHYDSKGDLWIGTASQVMVLRDGKAEIIMDSFASQAWAEDRDGAIWLGGWNPYLVKYDKGEITPIDIGTPINSIQIDAERNIWLGTWEKGLLKFDGKTNALQFDLQEGLTVSSIWNVMIDAEQTVWYTTFGAGVEQLVSERFSIYSKSNGLASNVVNGIGIDQSQTMWVATEAGLTAISENGDMRTYNEANGMKNAKLQGLLVDDKSDVWFVLYEDSDGLYKLHNGVVKSLKKTGGFDLIQDKKGAIWWGSDNAGAFRLKPNGEEMQLVDKESSRNRVVEVIEGPNEKIWIGVYYGGWKFYDYETDSVYSDLLPAYLQNESARAIGFDEQGSIWTSLGEKGLYRCVLRDNKLLVLDSLTVSDGLLTNKVSSIFIEGEDMWIATDLGISRLNIQQYYWNRTLSLKHLTEKDGFIGESYSNIIRKNENELLIGTSKGLLVYHEDKDKKISSQPFTLISEMLLNKQPTDWKQLGAVLKPNSKVPANVNLNYNENHITFIYKGISFSAPKEVRYQYILEGFDEDWSPLTSNSEITYSNIPPGDYTFKVKCMNVDEIWDESAEEVSIHISAPFWETWFFRILVLLVVSFLVFLIFKMRLRKFHRDKVLLEEKVAERTIELEVAYNQIEEKKLEITDSITYAKRIQTAILPPLSDFNKLMQDRFVLYKPKDIVAGDFYWLNEIDGKQLFAVGDCTGHGVPGAMVSVVCVGALNRSVAEFGLSNPAAILEKTREIVLETFEKSEEDVKDGMDISLCSWDKKTNELTFAGANNNLYAIQNGALEEVKADKQPIGKYEFAKPFINHRLSFEKGTCIYLFSDGYADQFGGTKGKKMKYKPFKDFLLANHTLQMKAQHDILDEKFEAWKGDFEQVDDVCIIGVRL